MGFGDGAGAAEEVEEEFGVGVGVVEWWVLRGGVGFVEMDDGFRWYCLLLLAWGVVDEEEFCEAVVLMRCCCGWC